MGSIYKFFEKTRQAFHKSMKAESLERFKEEIVLKLVQDKRKELTKVGTRKLHYLLKKDFEKLGCKVGRDKLFSILNKNGLFEIVEFYFSFRTCCGG